MRFVWLAPLVAALVVLGVHRAPGRASAPSGAGDPHAPVYLALGDSLAASMQPDEHGDDHATSDGYAEAVADARAKATPGLRLVKLGRGGETAASMIKSPRSGPSQLQQAETLLRSEKVSLVTIDIGANEVESCARGTVFDAGCVQKGLASLRSSLPEIIKGLRAAGGSKLRIVGINYYNSFLGRWVTGPNGRRTALASVPVERRINQTVAAIYRSAGVPMADVASQFKTSSFRVVSTHSYGHVPLSVERACRWTWACGERYDDHTNSAGYNVIARTVLAVVPSA
jgi:lysophospholipase L1-like esterase